MVKGSHLTVEQLMARPPRSAEWCARISAGKRGKPMADTTRAALLASNIGSHRIATEETRAKQSAARLGKSPSLETRARISVANTGEGNWHWCGGRKIWQARADAKRRTLGFIPLNAFFPGCEAHHIDRERIIHIPKALHQGIDHNVWTGKNMEQINALATSWLTESTFSVLGGF